MLAASMSGSDARKYTTAVERRLNDVEPLVVRLMQNGDALYAAGERLAKRVTVLEEALAAVHKREDWAIEALASSTMRTRLRWLLTGVTS